MVRVARCPGAGGWMDVAVAAEGRGARAGAASNLRLGSVAAGANAANMRSAVAGGACPVMLASAASDVRRNAMCASAIER